LIPIHAFQVFFWSNQLSGPARYNSGQIPAS
jgi:hypothetical protein